MTRIRPRNIRFGAGFWWRKMSAMKTRQTLVGVFRLRALYRVAKRRFNNIERRKKLFWYFLCWRTFTVCHATEKVEIVSHLHPAYKINPAMRSITRKPAIKMHPQRWLSPSFFLVNRMSESDDMMDSDLWWDGLKSLRNSWLHSLCLRSLLCLWTAWWWWCRWKFGWFSCWLLRIWSFKSLSFSLLSIRLSLIEIGDDEEVVVAVESDADDAEDSFLFDFFSFCRLDSQKMVLVFCWSQRGESR